MLIAYCFLTVPISTFILICVARLTFPGMQEAVLKMHQCSECGKAFGLRGNLNKHMLVHTQEKNFQYSECGKAFG